MTEIVTRGNPGESLSFNNSVWDLLVMIKTQYTCTLRVRNIHVQYGCVIYVRYGCVIYMYDTGA